MEGFLTTHLQAWGNYPYLIIFIGMLLEGNVTLFTTAFLLSHGAFNPLAALATVFAGAMAEDTLWFWIGRSVNQQGSKLADWAKKITSPFSEHLMHRRFRTLLISNFVYGIHRAVLFRAGMERFPLRIFKDVAVTLLIWIFAVGALGFAAGGAVGLVGKYFKYAQFVLLGVIIIVFFVERYIISDKLRKKL